MESAIPTEMDVAISIKDDAPPPPPPVNAAPPAELLLAAYTLLLVRTLLVCLLAAVRIAAKYENKNQPAFGSNAVFKIICIGALSAIAIVQVLLWCSTGCLNAGDIGDVYYKTVTFIGSLSMFLAPFSLMMVLLLPPKLNWIAYLAVCVIFGIVVTRFYLGAYQRGKRSSTFNYLVIFLVPSLLVLACLLPENLNGIVYPVIYISLGIENAGLVIAYLTLIYEKTRKRLDMEAH